ncbi:MAG: zinc-dependent metalloprotease [Saprospiraceae bacterium]
MKISFIFLLFLLATVTFLDAQEVMKPNVLIAETKMNIQAKSVHLFDISKTGNRTSIPKEIKEFSLLRLDKKELSAIHVSKTPFIALSIPQEGRNDLQLELVEVFPFAPGFSVKSAPENQTLDVNVGKHYRGIIKGQERSVVALSVFEDQVMAMISHPSASGNLVLGKLEGSDDHILYQDDQIVHLNPFECKTEDLTLNYSDQELRGVSEGNRSLSDCVRLYLEVNYDIYTNKGSSTANVTTFVTGLFNQVSALYTTEQINTVISEIVIWTQPSPYTSTSSSGMLNAFTANRQGFNGDLAQLLSYQASGGIAYVDGLCRSNPDYSMSYAGINSTYQNVPTYSWSVEVCTHEFGHLFGSQHTHACVWNGNNTAIDGCYSVEGNCSNPGLPSSGGGTIMSYCHLTNVGINFSNGFGSQPGNVIRSKVTNAACTQACSGGGGGSGGGSSCQQNVLTLQIKTDNYPTETTWNIKNSAGVILYSGGPYSAPNTINNIELCLPTACFTFTIFDAYGDGICCAYGSGYFNITQGNTTLVSGGQFTTSDVRNFCATSSAPTCTDGVQNGQETGIDCGGPTCPACPTCTDGIQNGLETGIDCGGPTCTPCATCSDGIQNGQETGVDCGGPSCPACPTNGSVQVTTLAGHYFETGMDGWTDGGIDCARVNTNAPEGTFSIQLRDNSGSPSAMTSPTYNLLQYDSITVEFKMKAVGFESGEDFWVRYFNGSVWATAKTYSLPSDFANNTILTKKVKINAPLSANAQIRFQSDASDDTDMVHIDAVIIKAYKTMGTPTCSDGIQNGQETGIDCGGPNCPVCISCTDGIQNGQETGIDCGGPNCPACPTCSDGVQNGQETGIDCGGPNCPACATCTDGIQNGQETGIDCGGPNCPACPTNGGTTTLSGHYFEVDWDSWIDGGSDCTRYLGSLSPEGQYSIRIRDNSAEQSAMTSPSYNLSSYAAVYVSFSFRAEGMESGEDFWLRYFDGTNWSTVAAFVANTDFVNNQIYTVTVNMTGNFSSASKFRFQCDASENDDNIYIDAVIISASTSSNLPGNHIEINAIPTHPIASIETNALKLYPNPVNDILQIESSEDIIKINLYNMSGQLVLSRGKGFGHSIDMHDLNSGMYIVRIETEENSYSERIFKK